MKWFAYNILFAIGYAAMMPKFLLRMKRRGGYRNRFADRFGRYPKDLIPPPSSVWVHAVSVGEVQVAGQFMRSVRKIAPNVRFVFSTTSSTGWKIAEKEIQSIPETTLIYNPLDFPPCVRRAFDAFNPRAIVLTETEIWPNLIHQCASHQVPLALVNARLSERSLRKGKRFQSIMEEAARGFSAVAAQTQTDADRLSEFGANQITVTGSVKFDIRPPEDKLQKGLRLGYLAQQGELTGEESVRRVLESGFDPIVALEAEMRETEGRMAECAGDPEALKKLDRKSVV